MAGSDRMYSQQAGKAREKSRRYDKQATDLLNFLNNPKRFSSWGKEASSGGNTKAAADARTTALMNQYRKIAANEANKYLALKEKYQPSPKGK